MRRLYGDRLSKLVLFGSYARGEQTENSDIDFMVVLKDKDISVFNEIERINNEVYALILDTGKIISFIPTTEDKFQNSSSFFYQKVKQEGRVV